MKFQKRIRSSGQDIIKYFEKSSIILGFITH